MPRTRRVPCEVSSVMLPDDTNRQRDAVCVTCSRCGHAENSFGGSNYYFDQDDEA